MNIINLTPHTINIFRAGLCGYEEILSVAPSGNVARLDVDRRITKFLPVCNGKDVDPKDSLGGLPLMESTFGEPSESELPEEIEGTIFIVSNLFLSGFDRKDLYAPGELLRDNEGRPIGCFGLSR